MTEWVNGLVDQLGYGGILFLMFLETIFPPIPSEVIMPLAGVAAARGDLSLAGVIAAGTAGAMAGNTVWYYVARWLGLARFRPLVIRYGRIFTLTVEELDRVDAMFGRRGHWFVCIGRVTPNLRSLVSVPAGLFGMRLVPFLIFSTIGTACWTGALAAAGYVLRARYAGIETVLGPASLAVMLLLAGLYVVRLIRRL
ncbi:DedA family protein [Sphingomonas quercus]|uniref:DedA family protein n=1 Tax=Sphingomonas quercus TaxID=2842451 RepID=A0ABS6BDS3_9SPHN|nr:DedA family protein [Sphingomonas quercus]MBU3076470.1 DedA family protein [Sphingomonas quercus]